MTHSRRWLGPGLAIVAAGVVFAACNGPNLFTGPSFSDVAPDIEIVAPLEGDTVTFGDTLSVTVNVRATAGVSTIDVLTEYEGGANDGAEAFAAAGTTYPAAPTGVTETFALPQTGGVSGDVLVTVIAFDALGFPAAEAVLIVLN